MQSYTTPSQLAPKCSRKVQETQQSAAHQPQDESKPAANTSQHKVARLELNAENNI